MSITFDKSRRTFLGFLQARGKALNTIKNYSCDLETLKTFCHQYDLEFEKLTLRDLEYYHENLRKLGLRANSRRRKLITAKTFLKYLSNRTDVSTVGSEKVIPPEKVEKPPKIVPREKVLEIIRAQPDSELGCRNRALVWVLLETGMLVTEALALRQEDCRYWDNADGRPEGASLHVGGKRPRVVTVSAQAALVLKKQQEFLGTKEKYFFYGYSRAGRNHERLTARGVELLFKAWAKAHKIKVLHPRTLRHIFVVDALVRGRSQTEVMQTIGLRTPYAFRVYRPLVEKHVSATK